MKRKIVTLTIVLAAFVLGILVGNHQAQTFNSSVAMAAPAPAAVPMPDRCPNIHGAQEAIRMAEEELKNAGHDFCGHRDAAMDVLFRAKQQLKLAEECDRCR
jgi:hypothetical protein